MHMSGGRNDTYDVTRYLNVQRSPGTHTIINTAQ